MRTIFFFMSILFGLYLYISALNPLEVRLQLYPKAFIETSLSILVMSSFFLGGLAIALLYFFRDVKRAVEEKGQRKRDRELWERLQRASEAVLRGRPQEAERHLQRAIRLAPERPLLYLRLAEVYEAMGEGERALEVLRRAKGAERQLEPLFMEAQILKGMGKTEEAAEALKEILTEDPSNLQALRSLRDLRMEEGRWEEAASLQERVVKLCDEREERELLLGLKYEKAKAKAAVGEGREAIKELKRLIKEAPSFVPAQVLWGDILMEMGKEKAALRAWQRGWEGTKDLIFLEKLEEAFLAVGNPRGIVHIYLEAMTDSAYLPVLTLFYARLCLRLGMLEEALQRLKEQESILCRHPSYHYLKAEIHLQREEEQEALHSYRRGLELEGKDFIPYHCILCGHESTGWIDRCPNCGRWSTFKVCELKEAKVPSPAELTPTV